MLKENSIKPIYLLVGPEKLLKEEFIDSLKNVVFEEGKKQLINFHNLYANEVDPNSIVTLCQNLSVFSGRVMVVVNNIDKLKNINLLLEYLKQPVMENTLILCSDKVRFNTEIEKIIKKSGEIKMFWHLFENQIPAWIVERVSLYQKFISLKDARYLLEKVGNNITDLRNEISKLVFYSGDRDKIVASDIDAIVSQYFNVEIDTFLKFLVQKDIGKIFLFFQKLVYGGLSIQIVNGSILKHLNILLRIKQYKRLNIPVSDIMNRLNITKYRYKIYSERESRISRNEIISLLKITNKFDIHTKSRPVQLHQVMFESMLMKLFKRIRR